MLAIYFRGLIKCDGIYGSSIAREISEYFRKLMWFWNWIISNNIILYYSTCFSGILKQVIGKCVEGATVLSVCEFGDERLIEETNKVFKKDKEIKKGNQIIFGQRT